MSTSWCSARGAATDGGGCVCDQNQDAGLRLDFSWTLKPNADYYPFFEHDIPVLMFHTGLHDEYHRPSDVAKLINGPGMQQVTRLLFRRGVRIGRSAGGDRLSERRPDMKRRRPNRLSSIRRRSRPTGSASNGSEDAAAAGGVRGVERSRPGSPADRAGLRAGDCIARFAGREIPSDDDFFAAVRQRRQPGLAGGQTPRQSKAAGP